MVLTVTDEGRGVRIDSFLADNTPLSRNALARLIDEKSVLLNGTPCQKKSKLSVGDVIEIEIPEPVEYEALAEDIPLDIKYEDDDLLVINKPSGMVVHPAPGNYSGTLVNALLYHCRTSLSGIGGVMRPGIVHRIDKDTSGLLVVAKNDKTHKALSEELGCHGIVREYHALVKGGFKEAQGTVNLPIARHKTDRKKMAVAPADPTAREAITHYEVIESFGNITYLKLLLETGRTHQIRVHMAARGHALIGDEVYSGSKIPFEREHKALIDGQILHAKRLSFTHPATNGRITVESDLPENFRRLLDILREQSQR